MELKYSEILQNQPIYNIGSIGHVASGKSTLVRSITGIKTQKHSSEQERNITINIGYANAKIFIDKKGDLHTSSSNNEFLLDQDGENMILISHISFVDVPGHDAFMSTMISGSAVMDACILVIASNENIPQPQTYEHFEAVKNVDIKDFVILQNKLDLVEKDNNKDILSKIKKFINNSVAENAPIIPSSIQNNINKNEILKNIVNISNYNNIKILNNKVNKDPCMIVIRSFDINKQNSNYKQLEGGVIGGSIVSGNLKIGDNIELRPGFIIDNKYRPVYSKIISLQSDTKKLNYALPGGLIGVCLDIDPSLSRSNGMVGQMLGHVGKLPPVYNEIKIIYDEVKRYDGCLDKLKLGEDISISINSMNIDCKVTKCKKNKLIIKLSKPVCIFKKQKIAIFKSVSSKWVLYATAVFSDGIECEKDITEDDIYNELVDIQDNSKTEINIINDLDNKYKCLELQSYDELINNIEFSQDSNNSIRIDPPIVKKVNRDSIFTNYEKFIESVNKNCKDITYNSLFVEFLKNETSATCDIGKEGIVIRGNFRNSHIQTIIVKFYNEYKKCLTCKSYSSYLFKDNRMLYKKCLDCSSQFCINK